MTNGPLIRPAKNATSTIPIVAAISSDPVKSGLAASFARPGGNLTGNALIEELSFEKNVEILHEIVPSLAIYADVDPKAIVDLSVRHRLPTIYSSDSFVAAGGLAFYGFDSARFFANAAMFVDRILKGARPGDLPFEQPTQFELVLNLKTAKALNITIPQSLLLRADKVIR